MACALGIEQDCGECRMCGNGKGGKKMTNADRIRNMRNEELASFLDEVSSSKYNCGGVLDGFSDFDDGCYSTLEWLNHEVSNNFKEWLESECDTK